MTCYFVQNHQFETKQSCFYRWLMRCKNHANRGQKEDQSKKYADIIMEASLLVVDIIWMCKLWKYPYIMFKKQYLVRFGRMNHRRFWVYRTNPHQNVWGISMHCIMYISTRQPPRTLAYFGRIVRSLKIDVQFLQIRLKQEETSVGLWCSTQSMNHIFNVTSARGNCKLQTNKGIQLWSRKGLNSSSLCWSVTLRQMGRQTLSLNYGQLRRMERLKLGQTNEWRYTDTADTPDIKHIWIVSL